MNERKELPQRIGGAMLVAGFVVALALLTVFFNGALERQHNPNTQVESVALADGVREVTLRRNRQGHYVASVRINGQPVEVLLDTGATTVSVPQALAERLGLPRGRPVAMQTANGVITAYATVLESVQLGDIVRHDVRATINPHSDMVLLGMTFLRDLEFTQRGDVLTLRQYP